MKSIAALTTIFILVAGSFFNAKGGGNDGIKTQPVELGKVNWLRDYDKALSEAKRENKQVLILFQEVPGCATCRNYGHNVLSNPLLVEAIEQYFIPLAIYNNKGGKDKAVLDRYNEPTWNNPVVRIVNATGENEVKRLASNYSALGLYLAMDKALEKVSVVPGEYFKLLGEELEANGKGSIKEDYFKMHCFWSGEGHLGNQEGVLSTEPGFMAGYEVVKVKYDENKISKTELEQHASKAQCSAIEKQAGYRIDKDPQYFLKKSKYRYLPLSPIQRTKINSAIANRVDPKQYLSPKQLEWFNSNTSNEVLYEKPFEKAWALKTLAENK